MKLQKRTVTLNEGEIGFLFGLLSKERERRSKDCPFLEPLYKQFRRLTESILSEREKDNG